MRLKKIHDWTITGRKSFQWMLLNSLKTFQSWPKFAGNKRRRNIMYVIWSEKSQFWEILSETIWLKMLVFKFVGFFKNLLSLSCDNSFQEIATFAEYLEFFRNFDWNQNYQTIGVSKVAREVSMNWKRNESAKFTK